MKNEKEVLEIVKDLNSRFLGKYYEGELIVAVDIHRGVDGFSICNFNEDGEAVYFKGFKLSEIDSIKVSDNPPADFKHYRHCSARMDRIMNVLCDDFGMEGDMVETEEEATSYEDLKRLLKEKL